MVHWCLDWLLLEEIVYTDYRSVARINTCTCTCTYNVASQLSLVNTFLEYIGAFNHN